MSYSNFTADVMRALGLTRLPVEGMEARTVLGVRVWVLPLTPVVNPSRFKRSSHRLIVQCPHCKWNGSLGRIDQHKCRHPELNCWGCGALIERETDTPIRHRGHFFCSWRCKFVTHDEQH